MKNQFQSRLFVALLALVGIMTSACSGSPTAPTPVTTEPGPVVGPSMARLAQVTDFTLNLYNPEHPSGGVGAYFTRTTGPIKILVFMQEDRTYSLLVRVTNYDSDDSTRDDILAETPLVFTGKTAEIELPYDASRCRYTSAAYNWEIKCDMVLLNRDSERTAKGNARVEGIPIR